MTLTPCGCPVAVAARREGHGKRPLWVVLACPYCGHPHTHRVAPDPHRISHCTPPGAYLIVEAAP